MPTARTHIPTDRASRYLGQLCEHLNQLSHNQLSHNRLGHNPRRHAGNRTGHRPDVQRIEWTDSHGEIAFPFGTCDLAATEDGLSIQLTAVDPEALQHLQDMFTARLETIGRRDNLVIDW